MLRGLLTIVLLLGSLLLWGIPVALIGIVKFAVQFTAPRSPLRTRVILFLAYLGDRWVATNDWIFDRLLPTRWDVGGLPDDLRRDRRYLIISNHVSWLDIPVLFRVFRGRAPFIRFFMKHRLIWFPVLGQACWALEFPFLRRYTAEYLQLHPEKRGKDVVTARRACQRYQHIPVTILSFLEGTRFSREKHADQDSPYRHLLRARVGAVAFVLASLGEQLDAVLDTTINYAAEDVTMWDFVTGRVPTVTIRVRELQVPQEFLTPAITEPGPERNQFRAWVDAIWREKDELLDALRAGRS